MFRRSVYGVPVEPFDEGGHGQEPGSLAWSLLSYEQIITLVGPTHRVSEWVMCSYETYHMSPIILNPCPSPQMDDLFEQNVQW